MRDETVVAMAAGLVDVENGDNVAVTDALALAVAELATRCRHCADRHVSRDDRIGDVELAVVEMDVGAADLRIHGMEERRALLELRQRKLSQLDGSVRGGEDGG